MKRTDRKVMVIRQANFVRRKSWMSLLGNHGSGGKLRIVLLAGILALLLPDVATAQSSGHVPEIMSKQEVRDFFSMSEDQWISHVLHKAAYDMTHPWGTPGHGHFGYWRRQDGVTHIVVLTYYENKEKPAYMEEGIFYSGKSKKYPDKESFKHQVRLAKNQMKPEYELNGYVTEEFGEIIFTIRIWEWRSE